ncbi:MAG: lipopolysaccharide assembly protein LapA domain-containing protein [Acidimicrobiales bacterium]
MSDEPSDDGRPTISPAAHDSGSELRTPVRADREPEVFRHTRTSAAWAAAAVGVIFGVALIDFIAQNTRDVRIEFFGANGEMPIAVALLAALVAGAIIILAIGVGRVAQLRLTMRRQKKHRRGSENSPG